MADGYETRFSAVGRGVAALTALAPFDDYLSMKAVQRANQGRHKTPEARLLNQRSRRFCL
jgi:hypothetical protein